MKSDAAALARSLDELTAGLTSIDSVEALTSRLAVTLAAARDVLQVDCVGLLLLDEGGRLHTVATTGPAADSLQQAEQRTGAGPGPDAMHAGASIAADDLSALPGYSSLSDLMADVAVRAVVCSPVRSAGEVVGELTVTRPESHHWEPREIAAIEAFAEVTGTLLALFARSTPPTLLGPVARPPDPAGTSPVAASETVGGAP